MLQFCKFKKVLTITAINANYLFILLKDKVEKTHRPASDIWLLSQNVQKHETGLW